MFLNSTACIGSLLLIIVNIFDDCYKLHFFLGVFLHFITGADSDDPFAEIATELTAGAAELPETDIRVTREDLHIHYCIGSGYAIPSPEGCAAVRRLARTEGILTDPVYTGKALAGFFQMLEQGAFDQDENILFVHTGGAGALFAVEMV